MLRLEFKPEDCWIGVFWKRSGGVQYPNHGAIDGFYNQLDVWVCLLPMLPIHYSRRRTIQGGED